MEFKSRPSAIIKNCHLFFLDSHTLSRSKSSETSRLRASNTVAVNFSSLIKPLRTERSSMRKVSIELAPRGETQIDEIGPTSSGWWRRYIDEFRLEKKMNKIRSALVYGIELGFSWLYGCFSWDQPLEVGPLFEMKPLHFIFGLPDKKYSRLRHRIGFFLNFLLEKRNLDLFFGCFSWDLLRLKSGRFSKWSLYIWFLGYRIRSTLVHGIELGFSWFFYWKKVSDANRFWTTRPSIGDRFIADLVLALDAALWSPQSAAKLLSSDFLKTRTRTRNCPTLGAVLRHICFSL